MKKHLIAVAVVAAVTAPAMAQNVSMYGLLDAGVYNTKGGDVSTTQLISSGHTSSRLGFRGSEDLGGGMKANFSMEAGLSVDNGLLGGATGATSVTAGNNQIFGRGIAVGISGNFGAINLGKISTHANSHVLTYTPGATNLTAVSWRAAATGLTGWQDNTVEYVTPAINGFTGRALWVIGNTTATASEGITDANKKFGSGNEFGLSYAAGPLTAGVYTAVRTAGNAVTKLKSEGVGATYNFGFARVGANYTSFDPDNATANDNRDGFTVGATVPMSSALTLMGFYGKADQKQAAANTISTTFTALGADYALSKRTTAYALLVMANNNNVGTNNLFANGIQAAPTAQNANPVPVLAAGQDARAVGFGLRHSF